MIQKFAGKKQLLNEGPGKVDPDAGVLGYTDEIVTMERLQSPILISKEPQLPRFLRPATADGDQNRGFLLTESGSRGPGMA
ncbi:MAG TPA: hypothetical protein PLF25_01795 [Accumulibacter sp.]|nr:hypothetical protein [Accumulibacter sp.]